MQAAALQRLQGTNVLLLTSCIQSAPAPGAAGHPLHASLTPAALTCGAGTVCCARRGLKPPPPPMAMKRAGSSPAATSSLVRQSASSAAEGGSEDGRGNAQAVDLPKLSQFVVQHGGSWRQQRGDKPAQQHACWQQLCPHTSQPQQPQHTTPHYAPSSCRYRQSWLLQGTPLRKALQYLVVPKHALTCRPFHTAPSSALIHRSASGGEGRGPQAVAQWGTRCHTGNWSGGAASTVAGLLACEVQVCAHPHQQLLQQQSARTLGPLEGHVCRAGLVALPPMAVAVAMPVLRLPVHRDLDGPPKLPKVVVLAQRLLQRAKVRQQCSVTCSWPRRHARRLRPSSKSLRQSAKQQQQQQQGQCSCSSSCSAPLCRSPATAPPHTPGWAAPPGCSAGRQARWTGQEGEATGSNMRPLLQTRGQAAQRSSKTKYASCQPVYAATPRSRTVS